jgi:hypothetical protein
MMADELALASITLHTFLHPTIKYLTTCMMHARMSDFLGVQRCKHEHTSKSDLTAPSTHSLSHWPADTEPLTILNYGSLIRCRVP